MSKALVILSGGQDSTTCLFWAKQNFTEVHAVTFNYGQRHVREIEAAIKVAELAMVASHEIIELGDGILGGRSPLTNPAEQLEQYANHAEMEAIIGSRVEKTFVPMRNSLFLTVAANRAVCRDVTNMVTGVCEADNANYPDCRHAFIYAQQQAINEALGYVPRDPNYIQVRTPLMTMTKAQSIQFALGMPGCYAALGYSHTAYDGAYPPTGQDHATVLRAHGFQEAYVPDPLVVRAFLEGKMQLPNTLPNYERWETELMAQHDYVYRHAEEGKALSDQDIYDALVFLEKQVRGF